MNRLSDADVAAWDLYGGAWDIVQITEFIDRLLADRAALLAELETVRRVLNTDLKIASERVLTLELEHYTLEAERDRLREWQATVTAALQIEGGAFFDDVAKHVRAIRADRDGLRADLTDQAGELLILRVRVQELEGERDFWKDRRLTAPVPEA